MSEDTTCAICGQSADDHFTEFEHGIPRVGSYDAQGNAQQCSGVGDTKQLIDATVLYYDTLRKQGIPESLAVRIVGDWYNGAVTLAVAHFHGKMMRGSSALSRQMVRRLDEDRY